MGADPRNAARAGLASRGLTEAQAPGGGGGPVVTDRGTREAAPPPRWSEARSSASQTPGRPPAPRLDGLHRPRVKPHRLARRPRSTPGPVVALCALRGGMSAFGHDPPALAAVTPGPSQALPRPPRRPAAGRTGPPRSVLHAHAPPFGAASGSPSACCGRESQEACCVSASVWALPPWPRSCGA